MLREAKRGACGVPELGALVAAVWAHTELAAVAAPEAGAGGEREPNGLPGAAGLALGPHSAASQRLRLDTQPRIPLPEDWTHLEWTVGQAPF